MAKFDNVHNVTDYKNTLNRFEKISDQVATKTAGLSGSVNDIISKTAQKSLSEPFKGTELEKPANAIDKATGWLDKKMAGWAGKKQEGGDKK